MQGLSILIVENLFGFFIRVNKYLGKCLNIYLLFQTNHKKYLDGCLNTHQKTKSRPAKNDFYKLRKYFPKT
jgi:hypothetical protein